MAIKKVKEVIKEVVVEEVEEVADEEASTERSNDELVQVRNTMDVTHYDIPAGAIGNVPYGVFRSTIGLVEFDENAPPAEVITEIPEYRDETGRANSDMVLVTNTNPTTNYGIQPGDNGYISYGLLRSSIGFREVENV